jgi:hypothetical protein
MTMTINVTRETLAKLGGPWKSLKADAAKTLTASAVVRDDQGWSVAYLPGVVSDGGPKAERLGAVAAAPLLVDALFKIASSDYGASSAHLIDEARLAMRYLAEKIEEARAVGPLV